MTTPQYLDRIIYVSQLFVLSSSFYNRLQIARQSRYGLSATKALGIHKIIHAQVTNITLMITNADIKNENSQNIFLFFFSLALLQLQHSGCCDGLALEVLQSFTTLLIMLVQDRKTCR